MARLTTLALFLLAGCGAAPTVPVSSEAPAPASPPPSTQGSSSASAPSTSATSAPAPSDDATADSSADSDAEPPPAAPVHVKTVEKALPNTPFFVTVPAMAVLKKGDRDLEAEVTLAADATLHRLLIMPRLVMFMPLDEELKDLAKDKLKVVSKSGSGDQYTVVYKPYPNMFTYLSYFTVGGKDMACLIEGLYSQDDLPTYDAICKSVRLKKR